MSEHTDEYDCPTPDCESVIQVTITYGVNPGDKGSRDCPPEPAGVEDVTPFADMCEACGKFPPTVWLDKLEQDFHDNPFDYLGDSSDRYSGPDTLDERDS